MVDLNQNVRDMATMVVEQGDTISKPLPHLVYFSLLRKSTVLVRGGVIR